MTLSRVTKAALVLLFSVAAACLASCGGGGGGSIAGGGGSTPVTPPVVTPGGWVSGVFQAASSFKDLCSTVRTGVDIEGNTFPDKPGTTLNEKNWLRSWTHETYLWNSEVVDTDPSTVAATLDYFGILKTNAITASGKAKDEFHFSEPTVDYLARSHSSASAGYGAEFVVIAPTIPRQVRVVFTEPGTPAEEVEGGHKKLIRGSEILTVNGVDLVNGARTQAEVDVLNAGLFPPTAGVTNTFTVRDPGSSTIRTISLVSQNLVSKPVNRTRVLTDTTSGAKIGYILFNTFSPYSSESEIAGAMQTMQTEGVQDLVLDLRYNGGGLLAVASELGYMVAGNARTSSHAFERLRFNTGSGGINPVTGQANSPIPFYGTAAGFSLADGTALPSLNLSRIFVLTTDNTCSASEAVINGLRGVGVDVILIGGKTCGKPYGFYPEDNCGRTYYSIQFQGVNDLGFGDFADGFAASNTTDLPAVKLPGCAIADDFEHELGDAGEGLLGTALSYRQTGVCPTAVSASAKGGSVQKRSSTGDSPALKAPEPWIMRNNLDMTKAGG